MMYSVFIGHATIAIANGSKSTNIVKSSWGLVHLVNYESPNDISSLHVIISNIMLAIRND